MYLPKLVFIDVDSKSLLFLLFLERELEAITFGKLTSDYS